MTTPALPVYNTCMGIELRSTVEFVKERSGKADLIEGQEFALVGVSRDGKAVYDGRMLDGNYPETDGRLILLDTFRVNDLTELRCRLGYRGFETEVLDSCFGHLSYACTGVTVSGTLIYDSYEIDHMASGLESPRDQAESLEKRIMNRNGGIPSAVVQYAPAVCDVYDRVVKLGSSPNYLLEHDIPKRFRTRIKDLTCLVGVTLKGVPVYDAVGTVPRYCLRHKVTVSQACAELSGRSAFYVSPYGCLAEVPVSCRGRRFSVIPAGVTLQGEPLLDADALRSGLSKGKRLVGNFRLACICRRCGVRAIPATGKKPSDI